jgi:hypothetical protein
MSELVAERPLIDADDEQFGEQFDIAVESETPVAEAYEPAEFAGISAQIGSLTIKSLSNPDFGRLARRFIPPTGKATPAAFNSGTEETPFAFQSNL